MSGSRRTAFVSYGQDDKSIAESVCTALEAEGVPCWIAPRDIAPGATWANAIIDAIRETSLMVLVLSEQSNGSQHVAREVDRAIDDGDPIFLFRTERVALSGDLEYYLATHQYVDVDATEAPAERHVPTLVDAVKRHLSGESPIEPDSGRKPIRLSGRPSFSRRAVIGVAAAVVALAGVVWILDPFRLGFESKVSLTFQGASEFSLSRPGEVRFLLENALPTLLTDVRVSSPLPVGLLSKSGTETLELFRGSLEAHEEVEIVGIFQASEAGEFSQTARVEVKGRRDAEADWEVQVVEPRVAISIDDLPSVPAGGTFTRAVQISNGSPVPVSRIELSLQELVGLEFLGAQPSPQASTEDLIGQWTLGDLGAGESLVVEMQFRATQAGDAQGQVVLVGDGGRVRTDRDLGPTVQPPDLVLHLEGPADAVLSGPFAYRFTVMNRGSMSAHDVKVVNELPWKLLTMQGMEAATFDIDVLPPGQERTFTLDVRPLIAGPYVNQARLRAVGLEAASNQVKTTVAASGGGSTGKLQLQMSAPERRYLGKNTTLEVEIRNVGSGPSRETLVQATLPSGTEFLGASGGGHIVGGRVSWMLGTIPAGASRMVSLTSRTSVERTVRFACRAMGFGAEGASGSAEVQYVGIPMIFTEAIVLGNPAEVGALVTIVVTVTNQGSSVARDVDVVAELPAELQFVSSDGPTKSEASGQTVTFKRLPGIDSKGKAEWRIVVKGIAAGSSRARVTVDTEYLAGRPMEHQLRLEIYQ